MKRRFIIAWRMRSLGEIDRKNWFRYLIGLYPLAEWEEQLILLPRRYGNGTGSL